VELLIGNEDAEYIRATFGAMVRRGTGWGEIRVQIDLVVHPFSCSFPADWETPTIRKFRSDLERAYETLEEEVHFSPDPDGTLKLELRGDGLGHFDVTGKACPNEGWRSPWLRFELPRLIDQTYLPPMINTLLEVEVQYPSE
jgi:hypothetical protein